MHNAVNYCLNVTEPIIDFLKRVESHMRIVADLSRSDILIYGRKSGDEAVVITHAQPRSIARVYNNSREGRVIQASKRPEVLRALTQGEPQKEYRSFITEGAPVVRKALPIYYPPPLSKEWSKSKAEVVAMLAIVTNLIEHERQSLRSKLFQQAVRELQSMALRGQLTGAEELSPFGEQDGIIFTDNNGFIRYASGIAANLHRRLGFKEILTGRHLADLDAMNEEFRQAVVERNRCLEQEFKKGSRVWICKGIPVVSYPRSFFWRRWFNFNQPPTQQPSGVLITIHDATNARRQDQEIRIKNAMIQEIHHRVKNNLQTIAGLLRMKARRVKSEEARQALEETLGRILSVAVIHEFLSNENSNIINIKDVSNRIIAQFQQGMMSPDQHIRFELLGDSIHLPARQATACSLIINELLQNSLEHGFTNRQSGIIRLYLQDKTDEVVINVSDNGDGLPSDFTIDQAESLGLHIVKILVEGDLRGKIEVANMANDNTSSPTEQSPEKPLGLEDIGASINITFPKTLFKGEQGWKEHVSL